MRYQVGPYILDTELRTLVDARMGTSISESDRLILALKLLVEHYPEPVSKELLIKHLWPHEAVTDWSISRLIADLRNMLASGGHGMPFIRTLRGKGFRLAVPVTPLSATAPIATEDLHPNQTVDRRAPARKYRVIAACLGVIAIIVSFYQWMDYRQITPVVEPKSFLPKLPIDTKIIPGKNLSLPVDRYWLLNDERIEEQTSRPAVFNVHSGKHIYTTLIKGPLNLQGAELTVRIKIDEALAASHLDKFYLFAQSFKGSWPGEWDCNFAGKLVPGEQELSCRLDEPGSFFLLDEQDYLRIGIQSSGPEASGQFEITRADIIVPDSIPIHSGWRISHQGSLDYKEGLGIPLRGHATLVAYDVAGPASLYGKTLAITLQADEISIASGITIQPFVQRTIDDWSGDWNCLILNHQLTTEGDTYYCNITETYLDILEGEYLQIGLQTKGRNMQGRIKVMGINILPGQ